MLVMERLERRALDKITPAEDIGGHLLALMFRLPHEPPAMPRHHAPPLN
jgi:hypothetical protein